MSEQQEHSARDDILSAIKRVAASNGNKAPGKKAFTAATGITEYAWSQHWSRWSDAVAEAGLQPNAMQPRLDTSSVMQKVAGLAQSLGRTPTVADLRVASASDPAFPSKNTIANHFGGQQGLLIALRSYCEQNAELGPLAELLPSPEQHEEPLQEERRADRSANGWVYLLQSGAHFKIGRSDELERRVKQISIALPEAVRLAHAIRTDDPAGIEAYWHRRFADKRANGEWFKLDRSDVAAFKRRKFQ